MPRLPRPRCGLWKQSNPWILLVLSITPIACQNLPTGGSSTLSTVIVPVRESRSSSKSNAWNRPRGTEQIVWGTPSFDSSDEESELSDKSSDELPSRSSANDRNTDSADRLSEAGPIVPDGNSAGFPGTALGTFVPYDPLEPDSHQNCRASFLDEDDSNVLGESVPAFRFTDDLRSLGSIFLDDGSALVNWQTGLTLAVAGGASLVIRNNLDHRVRDFTAEKPSRWGEGSQVLRQFGEFSYQVPVLFGVYGVGLWIQDEKFHDFSLALATSYTLNAATTVAIKGITNTTRPSDQFEGGHYGFPSYHASSTFCIAAVIDEYYGWQTALPAYALAGLVGWSRIDQREHDLSDVVFGAALGVVIGKTVAAVHLNRRANLSITPYYDPKNQGTGVVVEKRF